MFSIQIIRVISPFHYSIRQGKTGSAPSQHSCPGVQNISTLFWFHCCCNLHTRSPFGFCQPVSILRIAPQFVVQAHSRARNYYAGLSPAGYTDSLAHLSLALLQGSGHYICNGKKNLIVLILNGRFPCINIAFYQKCIALFLHYRCIIFASELH